VQLSQEICISYVLDGLVYCALLSQDFDLNYVVNIDWYVWLLIHMNEYQVLSPSKELEHLTHVEDGAVKEGLSRHTVMKICKIYNLNTTDVIKYQEDKSYM